MPVDQKELVGIGRPRNFDDRQQTAHPALAQPRPDRRANRSPLQLGDERFPVGPVDAGHRRRRLAADAIRASARPRWTCRCLRGCARRGGCRSARRRRGARTPAPAPASRSPRSARSGPPPDPVPVAARRRARRREHRTATPCRPHTATARSTPRLRPPASPVDRAIAGGRARIDLAPLGPATCNLGALRHADVQVGRVKRDRNPERLQPLDDVAGRRPPRRQCPTRAPASRIDPAARAARRARSPPSPPFRAPHP